MASLADAIRIFQSGGLSRKDFLAQVDRVLAIGQPSSARLLEILSDENGKRPLPPDIYAEVQRRIEHAAEARQALNGDETRVQTRPGDRPAWSPSAAGNLPGGEIERIKGVGDTLNGRFVLEECLGFGGMGTVYKALDLRKLEASDRKPYIAIKVLNVQFRGHPKSLIALQREAKKAQTLAHPNIVTVYDFDRDGSMVYLTMEYLSGQPLSRTLRAPDFAGLPCAQALRIVNGMGKALAYAHERGFVHCDFKPANVILTDSGEVKVIDFGIARVFHKAEEDVEATVFDPGSLGGLTPAYASPEILEHREPDPRDDIYALGCIAYELLTGRHPFDRLPATQARNAGMKPQRPPKLGRRQWRAIKAALSFDRATRTPSVAAFLQQLSGERPAALYVALASSSLAVAVIVAAAGLYFWRPRGETEMPPPPAETPAAPSTAAEKPAPAPAPTPAQAPPPLTLAAVTPLLARVPCSALTASLNESALSVAGYLPKSYGPARLKETLGELPGLKNLNLDVHQVGDEVCPVIKTFAPYWLRNRQAGGGATIRTRAAKAELTEGDPLVVDITTPAYDSYVYVDYYALDGAVAHLVPSRHAKEHQAPANYSASVGSLGNWVISKPFGNELIVLLTTPAPMFEGLRPDTEVRSEYLTAVEQELGRLAAKYGPERIAADFVQITTKARKP